MLYSISEITASDGTGSNPAIYPDDYTTQEVIINFVGNQRKQVVTFNINDDGDVEGPEMFTLTLTKFSGTGVVPPSVANVVIQEQIGEYFN